MENAEGIGENADCAPAFHACRKRTVLRPFDADRATRTGAPVTIRVGRFSPGSGGENGKDATDGKGRIDCRSWTFDREPDRGNALMIRFSVADPSCACSRTNISVRCPKPSKGVWLSHYVRFHKVYINTVGTVPKTRKIYPLYTN